MRSVNQDDTRGVPPDLPSRWEEAPLRPKKYPMAFTSRVKVRDANNMAFQGKNTLILGPALSSGVARASVILS